MKIVKKELKTYRVEAHCDKCDGDMEYNRLFLEQPQSDQLRLNLVPLYICKQCGHTEIVPQGAYPSIEYEEVSINLTKEIKKIFKDITQQE